MHSSSKRKFANRNCCVFGCHSRDSQNLGLSFHIFPKKGERKVFLANKFGDNELVDKRFAWLKQIRARTVTDHMRICSLHFKKDDFILPSVLCKTKRLKPSAIPTCKLPNQVIIVPRQTRRSRSIKIEQPDITEASTSPKVPTFEKEQRKHSNKNIKCAEALLELINVRKTYVNSATQVTSGDLTGSFINIIDSNQKLKTLTGIPSFNILNSLVSLYDSTYPDIKVRKLSSKEKIILTFLKLKLNVSYSVIAILFKYISRVACKKIFFETIDNLFPFFELLIQWPSKQECWMNMPKCFEEFSDTRVVLDFTEIPMLKPSCLCCRFNSYSHHKSHYTLKFMTGVSPGGIITYISKSYGGRCSDKVIFEQSKIIEKCERYEDAIMIDKGFRIDKIADSYGIKLIRPSFLRQQNQLTAKKAELNCKIARARVHIEKIFQRIKLFNILTTPLSLHIVPRIDKIYTIICGITNLSSPILSDDKFLA